ncbi:MAG: hypothetical protein HRU46_18110 [Verrucomicrobiales bacterium]|nr:hypothetical protein [Verrucomicrobiales bacterium]
MKIEVPQDFLSYLKTENPTAGFLTSDGAERYFDLCPESELEGWNQDYDVSNLAPGFAVFGTNGGGEVYAFGSDGGVYELPEIGMSAEVANLIFSSWAEFASHITPSA